MKEIIENLFSAKPDKSYYKRRGSWGQQTTTHMKRLYLDETEHIEDDGAYIKIVRADIEIYLPAGLVERIYEFIERNEVVWRD